MKEAFVFQLFLKKKTNVAGKRPRPVMQALRLLPSSSEVFFFLSFFGIKTEKGQKRLKLKPEVVDGKLSVNSLGLLSRCDSPTP